MIRLHSGYSSTSPLAKVSLINSSPYHARCKKNQAFGQEVNLTAEMVLIAFKFRPPHSIVQSDQGVKVGAWAGALS